MILSSLEKAPLIFLVLDSEEADHLNLTKLKSTEPGLSFW